MSSLLLGHYAAVKVREELYVTELTQILRLSILESMEDGKTMLCDRYDEGNKSFSATIDGKLSGLMSDDVDCAEQVEANANIETGNVESNENELANAKFKPMEHPKLIVPAGYHEATDSFSSCISTARMNIAWLQGMVPSLAELQEKQTFITESLSPLYENISEISRTMRDAYARSGLPFESAVKDAVTAAETQKRMFAGYSGAMTQFASQIESQNEGIRRMAQSAASAFADVWTPCIESITPLIEQFSSSISHVFEQLINDFPSVDWEEIVRSVARWGKYGWVIYPTVPISVILNAPFSRPEADKIMRSLLTARVIQGVSDGLFERVRRKKDLEEILWLFEQKHYKPCAMMLCSVIEGELFARAKKNGNNRRSAKEPIKRLKERCLASGADECVSACMALSACESYEHFYANGKDFRRDIEDDLNRNFLQHGMMYKRVTRTMCVKLLLLLAGIIEVCATYL